MIIKLSIIFGLAMGLIAVEIGLIVITLYVRDCIKALIERGIIPEYIYIGHPRGN